MTVIKLLKNDLVNYDPETQFIEEVYFEIIPNIYNTKNRVYDQIAR